MKKYHLPSLLTGALAASCLFLLAAFQSAPQTLGRYAVTAGDSSEEVFVIDTATGATWKRYTFGPNGAALREFCPGPDDER